MKGCCYFYHFSIIYYINRLTSNLLEAARNISGDGLPCLTSGSSPITIWCINENISPCLCVFNSKCLLWELKISHQNNNKWFFKKNLSRIVFLYFECKGFFYPVATQIGTPVECRCLTKRLAPTISRLNFQKLEK